MDHIHLRNMWVRIYLTEYVEQKRFKQEDAVPVLLEYLASDRPKTRKPLCPCWGTKRHPERQRVRWENGV